MGNAFTAQGADLAAAVSGLAQLMSDATVTGGALDGMTVTTGNEIEIPFECERAAGHLVLKT